MYLIPYRHVIDYADVIKVDDIITYDLTICYIYIVGRRKLRTILDKATVA